MICRTEAKLPDDHHGYAGVRGRKPQVLDTVEEATDHG